MTDKQYMADSLFHNTTCHYQIFYQSQVVPEKTLTKKKEFTHKQTIKQLLLQKRHKLHMYIPPIYFVYQGYN